MPNRSCFVAGCSLFIASTAFAQPCSPSWTAQPIGQPGIDGVVNDMAVWDVGTGPALYVSGVFPTAGSASAQGVAKWDGTSWAALGSGLTSSRRARVTGLAVFDDGSGQALYACGNFDTAGGVSARGVARWDGAAWSALGTALTSSSGGAGTGFKMTVFDDGSGTKLYVGGVFASAGNQSNTANIARWDGRNWSSVGNAIGSVNTLMVHDDGSGPALFAGGNLTNIGGTPVSGVAKWDGARWSALGTGVSGGLSRVNALAIFDDGQGSKLFAGGNFTAVGGIPSDNIGAWDGSGWQRIPAGGPDTQVNAMGVYDDGTGGGESLYIGGQFDFVGGRSISRIARYDGSAWSSLGSGLSTAQFDGAAAMRVFDDGQGPSLFVGGGFTTAGGQFANNIAQWGGCAFCYADCDQSGTLDIFDFLCFQNAFVAGEPYACDCDPDPACNIFDFLCFQSAFVAGCP